MVAPPLFLKCYLKYSIRKDKMKLPNNYGSITKLKGNRRRPYMVRKNKKPIGYFASYEEAHMFLAEFNSKHSNFETPTFSQVFEQFIESVEGVKSENTIKGYRTQYRNCELLYDKTYRDLRLADFREVFDAKKDKPAAQKILRVLLKAMDKFALEYDYIEKGYAEFLPIPKLENQKHGVPFTEEEISKLWEIKDKPMMREMLILIYTGMRPNELVGALKENAHLDEHYLIGGSKTRAGKNRIIPIHPKIEGFIAQMMAEATGDTLSDLTPTQFGDRMTYHLKKHGFNHTAHDGRHTLRTRLYNAGADEKSIDLILGHESGSTGRRIYTHKSTQELIEVINMID